MRNISFTLGCAFVAFLSGLLIHLYNKPPRNVAKETGIPVTATELYTQFSSDHIQANEAYLNKVLQVSGRVLTIKNSPYAALVVVLSTGDPLFGVACSLSQVEPSAKPVKPGEKVTVKGICTGYLSDVVLSNSIIR